MSRPIRLASAAFLLAFTAAYVVAQEYQRLPLFQSAIEAPFLEEAKRSSVLALAEEKMENQSGYLQAIQEDEAVISRAEQSPALSTSYAVTLVLASAHVDAARLRMKYAGTLKDLALYEQNQKLIQQHLDQVPDLVIAATRKLHQVPDVQTFKCRAYELVAHGSFLQGSLNKSPSDIDTAIKAYESTLACDPSTTVRTNQIISYLKGVRREMFISNDTIEKVVSRVVALSTGEWGSWLSAAVDGGYEYIKAHPRKPPL